MERVRYIFDSIESAAQGLETVLTDARTTESEYAFSGISAGQILKSGLILEGDIKKVCDKMKEVEGSIEFVE